MYYLKQCFKSIRSVDPKIFRFDSVDRKATLALIIINNNTNNRPVRNRLLSEEEKNQLIRFWNAALTVHKKYALNYFEIFRMHKERIVRTLIISKHSSIQYILLLFFLEKINLQISQMFTLLSRFYIISNKYFEMIHLIQKNNHLSNNNNKFARKNGGSFLSKWLWYTYVIGVHIIIVVITTDRTYEFRFVTNSSLVLETK